MVNRENLHSQVKAFLHVFCCYFTRVNDLSFKRMREDDIWMVLFCLMRGRRRWAGRGEKGGERMPSRQSDEWKKKDEEKQWQRWRKCFVIIFLFKCFYSCFELKLFCEKISGNMIITIRFNQQTSEKTISMMLNCYYYKQEDDEEERWTKIFQWFTLPTNTSLFPTFSHSSFFSANNDAVSRRNRKLN